MSGKTRKKRGGRRKDHTLEAMRLGESRRHAKSGLGYGASRREPHVRHTRHQQGKPF